ncbi:hypothetical protein BDW02DRAFT_104788 [Decorospora gaudefroyi]|uniref:Uncharacterized protein n=1 Tax=Decorospora gaudefroyi TaxID=184978 RepID=A0A6A5K744_9PLEO|nr:hypothetical protein BDW02DRAFT_104788 [Decorospora gaudefroyi]
MQFTTTLAAAVLAFTTGINAIPSPIPQVTLKIFNDKSGANAEATIPADGTPYHISDLFAGSAIDSGANGIFGTSALLTHFQDTTKCQLVNLNVPSWIIDLDGRAKNFVDLDGDNTQPIEKWLNGFTFHCEKAF